MLLFISFAVLAAAVTWAVTRPLLSRQEHATAPATGIAVYRDQLAEIESERAQGLIAGPEAEAARTEVARRLLKAAADGEATPAPAPESTMLRTALWSAAALPVLAIALYLAIGRPGLPARPYASRIDAPVDQASANDLVAKVEAHLRKNPNDGQGWDVIAPVYLRMGEFQQSADAFENATRILGESPKRLAGFARATIFMQNGVVTEPARRAYEKLAKLDPSAIEPKVWLAIAREQDGDIAGAAFDFKALADSKPDEPWASLIKERLEGVNAKLAAAAKENAVTPPSPPAAVPDASAQAPASKSGPSSSQVESVLPAIHNMTPEQRQAFIERMVAGLAERLKTDGKNLEDWMQLVHAYVVLGRKQQAADALASARQNFSGDESALSKLKEFAVQLGVES